MTRKIAITHPVDTGTYLVVELLRDQPADTCLEVGLIVQNFLAIRSRERRDFVSKTVRSLRETDAQERSRRTP